jgi:DNA-binding response OmpR family regulator
VVVDDDAIWSEVLTRLVIALGFTATRIKLGTAEQMAQAIETAGPELVLLDLDLAVATGYDVAQRLRARGYSGTIAAVTGEHLREPPGHGRLTNFDAYWRKPVYPDRMKVYLRGVLGPPSATPTA